MTTPNTNPANEREAMIEAAKDSHRQWMKCHEQGDDRTITEVMADFALAQTESLTERLTAAESRAEACEKLLAADVIDMMDELLNQWEADDHGDLAIFDTAFDALKDKIRATYTAPAEPVADTEEVER